MDGRATYPIRGTFRHDAIIGMGSFACNNTSSPATSSFRGSLKKLMAVTYSATGIFNVSFSPVLLFHEVVNVLVSSTCKDMTNTNRFHVALKGDVSATTGAFSVACLQTLSDAVYGVQEYQIQKILDAAAGTNYTNMGPVTKGAITVTSVTFGPDANVTADGSNYKTFALVYDDGAGGSETTVASIDTSAASWTAGTLVTLTLTANVAIPAGKQLKLKSTKTGTGVALAGGTCSIQCTNTQTSLAFAPPADAANRITFFLEGLNVGA